MPQVLGFTLFRIRVSRVRARRNTYRTSCLMVGHIIVQEGGHPDINRELLANNCAQRSLFLLSGYKVVIFFFDRSQSEKPNTIESL